MCLFIELCRHVYHGERMNSIDFGGYRSKVKVRMGIIDKYGVRGDAMLCVVIFTLEIFCLRKSCLPKSQFLLTILMECYFIDQSILEC